MKGNERKITQSLSHLVTQSHDHSVTESHKYRTTSDIIRALEEGTFPRQAMMTFHPQRWSDKALPWLKELIWQNIKNQGKRFLLTLRK